MGDAEQIDHIIEPDRARGRAAQAIAQIRLDIHVRKQPRILKHLPNPALLRLHPDAMSAVLQHLAIERDMATFRAQQPGDGGDDGGFAGAGRAEHHRQPR